MHTALAAAKQRAVNNLVSYFGAWTGSKAFQSPLKGCFQNFLIGLAGRDKREVLRGPCGVIAHTERAGRSAKPAGSAADPPCQRSLRATGFGMHESNRPLLTQSCENLCPRRCSQKMSQQLLPELQTLMQLIRYYLCLIMKNNIVLKETAPFIK